MAGDAVRRLTLLRHAKAEPDGASDHERVLAARGREQCLAVAEHLRAGGRVPHLVLCSTATRTRQTWELVARAVPAEVEVRFLDELYQADVDDVLAALAAVPADTVDVLVVGHEPTMSRTGHRLAGPGSDRAALARARSGVPTASLTLLTTTQEWAGLGAGDAVLEAVLTP